MIRELTETEKYWVQKALSQEPKLSDTQKAEYKLQLEYLKVIEEYDCGDPSCGSVRFSNHVEGHSVAIADGIIHEHSSEEFLVILFIENNSNGLSELDTVK